jgi:type I restriction enzyme S subunit
MNFLIDNFKHLTTTPENVEQLKKLVLQMAVQGKLTSQWRDANPDVEPASGLLEKIKAEKEKLITEGKIRSQKPLPQIAHEEKPFELPENWIWVRLIDYGLTNTGTTPSKNNPEYFGKDYSFVKPAEISYNGINYDTDDGLTDLGLTQARLIPKNSVLMVCIGGSIGKCYYTVQDVSCNQQINTITPLGLISSVFLNLFLQSDYFQDTVWGKASGGTTPIINKGKWERIPLPLPPHAEQQAIVSQVEKLFIQIDQLHALAQKRLNYREKSAKALFSKINHSENNTELQETWQTLTAHFHTLTQSKESVKQLRQSILQMAVQGKLTAKWREENPDVESVTDLYEKIKIENEEIKSKYNLRNQKTLLEISEDEKLFQTPDSWAWFRLGKLFYTTSGGTPTRGNTDYWDGNIPWLKSGELTDGLITKEAEEKITELGHKKSSTNLFPKDTLLIALYGATAGKLGILTYPSTTNQAICGFYANSNIETDYLFYYLWAFRSKILSDSWGQAQPNISQDYLKKFCFALPPHEEQKAIVSKVKQLMAWCDELEKKIEKRDVYQAKMMQAVVKQAFKTEKETVEME